MSKKQIALNYLKKGLSVIPLWSYAEIKRKPPVYFANELNSMIEENKKSDRPKPEEEVYRKLVTLVCKRPMWKWGKYQNELPTEAIVSEWFDMWPDANIGIVTGKISNLVVFDLDSSHAVEYAEKKGGFPDTPKVKTGKGFHHYMRHPGFEVRNDVRKELDLDIRADGGYVAAPPSVHGSGNQYQWEDGLSIFDINPAPCESWMIDYLKEIANSSTKTKPTKLPITPESPNKQGQTPSPDSYAAILKNGALQGNRNHIAAKLIGHLLGKGNDENVAWEIIKQWNATKNNPSLDEFELRTTFDSISKNNSKSGKATKDKKVEDIDVMQFLDTESKVTAEYDDQYLRIPFAGSLLSIMESKMNGGLIGGRTYVLGGIPSANKTNTSNNLADNICMNGHPVLFFSYDDGKTELRFRTYSRFSGFGIEDFNNHQVTKADLEAICRNSNVSLINKNKYVVDRMIKIDDWPKLIEKIQAHTQKAPVVIIDYLRKIKAENNQTDERLRVDGILSNLTNMAKAYNIPVLVISELARDSYKTGQRLSMASFKESGSIEYEASWLGILAAVEEDAQGYKIKNDWERIVNHDGNIDLIVFKAKRGTGITGRIPLKLDKNKMTVRDRIEATHSDIQPKRKSKYGN